MIINWDNLFLYLKFMLLHKKILLVYGPRKKDQILRSKLGNFIQSKIIILV